MLKQLYLQNIVLIEKAVIPFQEGFNVISGETGAGKSALMAALQQLQGTRADPQLIRHGFDKGVIEAIFDIDTLPQVRQLLLESGIDHEKGDELLIKRDISAAGKSRLFINNQVAHLSTLRKIGGQLFDIVDQHAGGKLHDPDHHLVLVDLYGELSPLRMQYEAAFSKEVDLKKRLVQLENQAQQRERELGICLLEIEELQAAELQVGEEEELFAEYTRLTNSETLAHLSASITATLDDQILPALRSLKQPMEKLHSLDPQLCETQKLLQSTTLELQELSLTYCHYQSSVEHDPYRTEEINQRLAVINKMKKKYGPSVEEALKYKLAKEKTLFDLENTDNEIDNLKTTLQELEIESARIAEKLSQARAQTAKTLEKAMTKELRDLNMPDAFFTIRQEPVSRSRTGVDKLEFYFTPNKGEKSIPIKECASGGEMSRIQLSIQTLLAGKKAMPCLIFDEIDANIGGHTAAIVGKKLLEIGQNHQLLCITHFPQVAGVASHHIQIAKKGKKERTVTEVNVLNHQSKELELLRMSGLGV